MFKIALATGVALAALTGAAMAADLIVPEQSVPVVDAAASSTWDGFYIGANVGYGPGTATSDNFGETTTDISFSGLFVGGQVGYNYTLSGNVVLGIEGDLNWANESGSVVFPNGGNDPGHYETTEKLDWTGAVTGHIGVAFDNIMPYFLGGVAFAGSTLSDYDVENDTAIGSQSQTHIGFTVGVGVAAMVTSNMSVFAEYRYTDYGSKDYSDIYTDDVGLTDNSVRAGFNFHF